jgi:4-diphosphocytidyl-2-C-methyl-D-erythritol kinase
MALQLGSDCPFFLVQKAALGEKRGEKLTPLSTSLSGYQILLIHPGFSISTAEAFEGVKPNSEGMQLSTLISQPVEKWKDVLHNQFEETIFLKFPALGKLKNNLYNAGAIYAAMSGSGSTIFGIFPPEANRPSMGDYSWMQWRKFP